MTNEPWSYGKIELIGQNGTAYTGDVSPTGQASFGKHVVDVRTRQTKWTLPLEYSWLAASPDGGAMMQNASGQLRRFDGAGQLVEATSLSLNAPVYHLSNWISAGGRLSMFEGSRFLDGTYWDSTMKPVGSTEKPRRYGNASNQNAPRDGTYPDRETAALAALTYAYRLTDLVKKEYGGLICAIGTRFEWSAIVTDNDQSSVTVPNSLCSAGTLRAHFHTHPRIELSGAPTDPQDYNKADQNPGIPYYLRGPHPNATSLLTTKYWNGAGRPARQNLCLRIGNSWVPYEQGSGAICATPKP